MYVLHLQGKIKRSQEDNFKSDKEMLPLCTHLPFILMIPATLQARGRNCKMVQIASWPADEVVCIRNPAAGLPGTGRADNNSFPCSSSPGFGRGTTFMVLLG